ncbi:MAG: hypothetical protein HOH95_11515 [Dehalococcoidia bacterium]|jgi:hypothetical protein|nr:hypothetical protein [Dehalococcoidia bacterium]
MTDGEWGDTKAFIIVREDRSSQPIELTSVRGHFNTEGGWWAEGTATEGDSVPRAAALEVEESHLFRTAQETDAPGRVTRIDPRYAGADLAQVKIRIDGVAPAPFGPQPSSGTVVEPQPAQFKIETYPPEVNVGGDSSLSLALPIIADSNRRERIVTHAETILDLLPGLSVRARGLGLDDRDLATIEQTILILQDLLEYVRLESATGDDRKAARGIFRRASSRVGMSVAALGAAFAVGVASGAGSDAGSDAWRFFTETEQTDLQQLHEAERELLPEIEDLLQEYDEEVSS